MFRLILEKLKDCLTDHDRFDPAWMDEAKFYGHAVSNADAPISEKKIPVEIIWR